MSRPDVLRHTARYIVSVQSPSGAIPWFENGILDPWDHVEAAMGLAVGGYHDQAAAAYRWLARHQRPDGAWLAAYQEDAVVDGTRAETNFVAYVATGVWHHYLITGDREFLAELWPTVKLALDFVTGLQAPAGEIYWAQDTRTGINKDALVTGCSSIHKSLECGLNIAFELGEDPGCWLTARDNLGHALRNRPERFDRTWESKDRYSMDWFYPVLAGVYEPHAARLRIEARWSTFVAGDLGCRCVSDQNWVTVAESCELAMACVAADLNERANTLFDDLARYQAEDGSWWTGYAFDDEVMWPDERPTWTAGAVMLAADALDRLTPAAGLFTSVDIPPGALPEPAQHAQSTAAFQRLEQSRR
ncbi:MAG: prenyltransferase [Gammaproteobacteria bacterium]|nr:prenyltransferase [Gammaproteobacteria bacterium]